MVKNSLILEGCVDSVLSAKNATEGGANRLELCSNLIIGGTSPSTVLFKEVRKKCHNTIHVLIRPRFGDFCYDEDEFSVMLNEVKEFRQLGADGVVIGNLLPNGDLNLQQTAQLCLLTEQRALRSRQKSSFMFAECEAYQSSHLLTSSIARAKIHWSLWKKSRKRLESAHIP